MYPEYCITFLLAMTFNHYIIQESQTEVRGNEDLMKSYKSRYI